MSTTDLVPLPEDDAREAINRWSQGFFRVRYLGDKIFLDEIVPCFSYNIRLRSQYEQRTVSPVSIAYHGQLLDDQGTPPDPWNVAVTPPTDFEERTETLPVPHTDRVGMCPRCAGVGRISCSHCQGSGQTICPACGGRGYVERQEAQSVPTVSGQPALHTKTLRASCPHCFQGRVSCSRCAGNGRQTCATCEGSGHVKTFDQLQVRFHSTAQHEVLDATDLPDPLIGKLKGEAIFDRRAAGHLATDAIGVPGRLDCPSLPPHIEEAAKKLLGESQKVDERQTRLLFQNLEIDRVPVHEVRYTYAGVPRRLWIYGNREVYAPGAPWRRDRLFIILATIAGVVITVALLVILLRG